MPKTAPPIELRISEVGQLFHTLDPLPFRERDLDASVEEYVVGWAGELPGGAPPRIVVHLPRPEAESAEAAHIPAAIANYFTYRAEVTRWELDALFRTGRLSLLIGMGVLAACVVLAGLLRQAAWPGTLGRFFDEGLIILGWVANWRPVQIFLYDWWPVDQRRRLLRRLAASPIELRPYEPARAIEATALVTDSQACREAPA